MAKRRPWVRVLCISVVFWAGGMLGKHFWSHEAWGHAALAGVSYGMLALASAGATARTQALRDRRRKAATQGPPPPLPPGVLGSVQPSYVERGESSRDG